MHYFVRRRSIKADIHSAATIGRSWPAPSTRTATRGFAHS
jgi:hypothetical protein